MKKYIGSGEPLGTTVTFYAYINPDEGDYQYLYTDKLQGMVGERVEVTVKVLPQKDPLVEAQIDRRTAEEVEGG